MTAKYPVTVPQLPCVGELPCRSLATTGAENSAVLGDKANATTAIVTYIKERGGDVVIPPKSNTRNPLGCCQEELFCLGK